MACTLCALCIAHSFLNVFCEINGKIEDAENERTLILRYSSSATLGILVPGNLTYVLRWSRKLAVERRTWRTPKLEETHTNGNIGNQGLMEIISVRSMCSVALLALAALRGASATRVSPSLSNSAVQCHGLQDPPYPADLVFARRKLPSPAFVDIEMPVARVHSLISSAARGVNALLLRRPSAEATGELESSTTADALGEEDSEKGWGARCTMCGALSETDLLPAGDENSRCGMPHKGALHAHCAQCGYA